MAEEEKKNQEQNQNESENKSQEELAKEWEEALKQQQEQEKSQEDLAKEWEEALKQQEEQKENQENLAKEWEEVLKQQEPQKSEADRTPNKEFELLKDIPLEISVEIGSTKLPLEEILRLHANSVVELDRFINEPVDIKINGKLVAKGELYQVKENYGVKITQIITPEERLKLIEE